MVSIRRILFPTDFSEASEAAWPYAKTLADQFGAEVILLHVMPEPAGEVHLVAGFCCGHRPTNMVEWGHDHFRRDLTGKAAESKFPLTPRVREGLASWEIVKEAREAGADLIVMGTHGRTGLTHLLRGSVAESVVREAPCPVITVRPSGLRNWLWGRSSVRDKAPEPAIAQQSRAGDGSHYSGAGSSKQASRQVPWTSTAG